MSPTQKLRNMIDDLAWGGVKFSDLTDELDALEVRLGLPKTTASDESAT